MLGGDKKKRLDYDYYNQLEKKNRKSFTPSLRKVTNSISVYRFVLIFSMMV